MNSTRHLILHMCKPRQFSPRNIVLQNSIFCTEAKPDVESKKSWRVPWSQKKGEWYSSFQMFAPEKGESPDLIRVLQSKIDLRPKTVLKWWKGMKKEAEILDMRYIPERHEILGSDLAAAHFLIHRGATVRFVGSPEWIKRIDDSYDLPNKYDPSYVIEAIDVSSMRLYYEGFQNMTKLKKLQWLNLANGTEINDWCLDKISGEYQSTLEYLDISNCSQVTHRGIGALYRMSNLRTLKVHNIASSEMFQLTCLMLEELHPKLKIEGVKYLDLDKKN